MVDVMDRRLAAADVIRDILDIGGAGDACGCIQAGDFNANPVTGLKHVGRGQDFYVGSGMDLNGQGDRLFLLASREDGR